MGGESFAERMLGDFPHCFSDDCFLNVGALDVSEGVGAVFGIPHVPELWDEVARPHSRSRSGSYRPRSRSRSRSALLEVSSSSTLTCVHKRVRYVCTQEG